jgi:ribose/xylose/arabinose/galactoside ABC-type transport system permease subunit
MSSDTATPPAAEPRWNAGEIVRELPTLLLRYGMVAVLLALLIVTSILDSSFLEGKNLLNIALEWAPVGLMAIGMTYVIIAGGFDLSVGGTYAMGGVIFATVAQNGSVWLGLAAALAAGAVIGVLNGTIITRLEVNPFVATLGTGFMIRGLALVATSATPILVATKGFTTLGTGKWGPVPIPVIILVVGLIIGGFILARTVYGTGVYAVGGNEESSRLAGLPTRLIRGSTYVITGVGAALAGSILASRLSSGQANVGETIELDVITVVVVGGTALTGGDGAMWRTAVGISILAVLGNAFDRLQVNPFWQLVIKGGIIVFAIAADSYAKRRADRARREQRQPAATPTPAATTA